MRLWGAKVHPRSATEEAKTAEQETQNQVIKTGRINERQRKADTAS